MKKILVHTGFPKTGTTSIQRFLAQHQDILKTLGIRYPVFANHPQFVNKVGPNHLPVLIALMKNAPPGMVVDIPISNKLFEATFAEFLASEDTTLIISHESLSEREDIDFLKLQHACGNAVCEALTYVRIYDEWLESRYGQYIRTARTLVDYNPKRYLARLEANSMLPRLRKIRSALPAAKMTTRSFDRFRKGGLIEDFLTAASINHEKLAIEAPKAVEFNPNTNQAQTMFIAYVKVGLQSTQYNAALDYAGRSSGPLPFAGRSYKFIPQILKSGARELHREQLPLMREEFDLEVDDVPSLTEEDLNYSTSLSRAEFDTLLEFSRPFLIKPEDAEVIASAYDKAAPLFAA